MKTMISPSKKVRKDDQVIVIAGNNRGKTGKVMRVSGERVYINGVNLRKKHVKPTRTSKGGVVDMEMPINVSNVKVCVGDNEPVKLKVRKNSKGQRELFYKKGSNEITHRVLGQK